MKRALCFLLVGLVATAIGAEGQLKLPDGRLIDPGVLKVTLKDAAARRVAFDRAGRAAAVDAPALARMHADIDRIEAGHTSARAWLRGDVLPLHLRAKNGETVPRIARNFNVVLRPGADVVKVRAALLRHADVERVDFKSILSLGEVPNDMSYNQQWAPALVGLPAAWEVPARGHVRVAVIDVGVDLDHPEFAGRVVFSAGYTSWGSGDPPDIGNGCDHGTHVAGIICATRNNSSGVAGYSNEIDLMVMGCASFDQDANIWKIRNADDAMDDAVDNGARVINCSFEFDDSIQDEVDNAFDHNVLVVHAAGNNATTTAGHWETGDEALITVTATKDSTNIAGFHFQEFDASYSNHGPNMDFSAPGTGIYSTTNVNGYGTKSGTSMAAPQVSGAAGLIFTLNPGLLEDHSVRDLLKRMARDAGDPGPDEYYGYGTLFLDKTMLQVTRAADTFVSSVDNTGGENGHYDEPWHSIPAALAHVPDGATVVLNGGDVSAAQINYPPQTIIKPCKLIAYPDRRVVIGQ